MYRTVRQRKNRGEFCAFAFADAREHMQCSIRLLLFFIEQTLTLYFTVSRHIPANQQHTLPP